MNNAWSRLHWRTFKRLTGHTMINIFLNEAWLSINFFNKKVQNISLQVELGFSFSILIIMKVFQQTSQETNDLCVCVWYMISRKCWKYAVIRSITPYALSATYEIYAACSPDLFRRECLLFPSLLEMSLYFKEWKVSLLKIIV